MSEANLEIFWYWIFRSNAENSNFPTNLKYYLLHFFALYPKFRLLCNWPKPSHTALRCCVTHSCSLLPYWGHSHHNKNTKWFSMSKTKYKISCNPCTRRRYQTPQLQIIFTSLWWNVILLLCTHYKCHCAHSSIPMSVFYWKVWKSSFLLLVLWESKFAYIWETAR